MKSVNDIISPFLLAVLIAVLTPQWCAPVQAGASDSDIGNHRTYYSTIHYSDDGVLYEFGRRIGGGPDIAAGEGTEAGKLISEKVDNIVFKVRNLLGMHPPGFHFNIRLYGSTGEIKEAYRALGHSGPVPSAFYSHGTRSIHLAVEKVSEGMLAHEVAHVLINSFYDPPIPARMQEILSQYVDEHLRDTE